MSDSSEDDQPFQLHEDEDDSDDERPNKRRKTLRQPALRARGMGFVQAAKIEDEDDEDQNDLDNERPSMGLGMGGFRSGFNIGEYNGGAPTRTPSPEASEDATSREYGRGPSAFGAGGRIQKNSFAARMMAKQGYVEGQGLGKSGQGITAPIQADVLQSRAGLGHGKASDKPARQKKESKTTSQISTPGASTPRLKAPPRARYAVSAIESRGLHIPAAMKSLIIDATGAETKTVSSLSGVSTPTDEVSRPSEMMKASSRIKMQLQAYADAWDSTKEQETRLDQEYTQLEAAAHLHESESQRYQDIISTFERVSMDDSNQTREWGQIVLRLQDIQDRFSDYIEDLELPELACACLEAPMRRELLEWQPLEDPSHLIESLQTIGALMELEKSTSIRHRKRTTTFESLLALHWYPRVRSALKDWDVYEPEAAVTLVIAWSAILPPWLTYKVMQDIILPKLIEAVRRFPKTIETSSKAHKSTSKGTSSSRNRRAPKLDSWLVEWWSLLSSQELALERFPELVTLIKTKVDSESWQVWKPLLGSRRKPHTQKPISVVPAPAVPTPSAITSAMEEMSFKDTVEDWCSENNLTLRSSQKADTIGRLLYRLQDAERRSKGILVYLQDDVVFTEDGEPCGLDDGLIRKATRK